MSAIDFTIQGIIFDVDETLLDTYPDGPLSGLHEAARLRAIHEIGKRLDNERLKTLTLEDSHEAFRRAKLSTGEAAIWEMLLMCGAVSGDFDQTNPLVTEVIDLKNAYFQEDLQLHGKPVLDAERFVRGLALAGYGDHLAIASSGRHADIVAFLEIAGIADLIPESRIQSFESVTNFKPHPEPYEKAFASLGLPETSRPQVIAFEDDPRGVASAKEAGLYVCAITTDKIGKHSRKDLELSAVPPDLIADSWAEFAELLNIPLAKRLDS